MTTREALIELMKKTEGFAVEYRKQLAAMSLNEWAQTVREYRKQYELDVDDNVSQEMIAKTWGKRDALQELRAEGIV